MVEQLPRSMHTAAKAGGYGALALAAWLCAAVSTGYGLASADTGAPAAGSSTSSPAASDTSSTPSGATGPDPTAGGRAAAQHVTGGAAAASAGTTGPTSTADAKTSTSGATGSATEVAPGVIVSSSGGSHTTPTTPPASLPDETAAPLDPDSESPTRTEPAASPKNTSTRAPTKNTGAPARLRTPAEQRRTATRTAPAVQAVSAPAPTNAAAVTTTTAPTIASTAAASTVTALGPAARIGTPTVGVIGFLNGIVTKLLNPFLAPPPATPNPFTPAVWAVLGWVRRSLFNQSPTITYNPATTVQSGQTVTGNIGATDPEGDRLTYTIKKQPRLGTLTIDQATGTFTYTPSDPNLSGPLVDSFTVRVSDGKLNLLDLWRPHADQVTVGVSLLTPATVGVDFGSNQGWLLHTEAYNNFHVSSTFAGQRPEDVDFLNAIGLHGALYRVWLNSPNQTDPVCTTSSGTCTLSPGFDAYLSDIEKVSDAQIANLRLDAWIGQDAATARPQIERMLLAIKQAHPEIQYIEAWNEPDAPGTKILPAQVYQGYVPLYQAVNNINAALGATAGYVPLKVGGPALYYFNTSLLSTFLDAYVADPDPNKRLDFLSYHAYVNILPDGTRQFYKSDPSLVKNYRDQLDALLVARGLPVNLPAYITETGIYPGPLCDMCDSTDYARQAAGIPSLQYWFAQQHDTYPLNWVARRQGLKDEFVTRIRSARISVGIPVIRPSCGSPTTCCPAMRSRRTAMCCSCSR